MCPVCLTFIFWWRPPPGPFRGLEMAKMWKISFLRPFLAPSEPQERPGRADWCQKHFHAVCLDGTHPYNVLGTLRGLLRHSWSRQKGRFSPRVPFWRPEAELLPSRWCHPGLPLILWKSSFAANNQTSQSWEPKNHWGCQGGESFKKNGIFWEFFPNGGPPPPPPPFGNPLVEKKIMVYFAF